MLKSSANFDTYNADRDKAPVWIVEFDGIATKFSSGTFGDINGSYKKYLKGISRVPLTANLLNFRTEFGGFDFEILDKGNDLLGLFTNSFTGREITVKIGFQEINIADFVTLPKSFVVDFGIRGDLSTYWFRCRNILSRKRPIMGNVGRSHLVSILENQAEKMTNGDCEDALPKINGNSATTSNCGTTKSGLQKHGGSYSMMIEASADGGYSVEYTGDGVGLIEGRKIDVSVWVYLPSGQHTDLIELYWENDAAGDTFLDDTTSTDTWVELTGQVTLTDETNSVILKIVATDDDNSGDNTDEKIYADDFSVKQVDDSCEVENASGFSTAGSADWGSNTYIKIGREIMKYTALASNVFTIVRAQLGTQIQEHQEGDEVIEIIRIDETNHGLTFLMGLLTTTPAGANGAYDLGRSGWGLGIDVDLLDVNQIKNELGDYGKWGDSGANNNDYNATVDSSEPVEDGMRWIEQNILALLPAYFLITDNGLVGVKCWDVQGADNGLNVLDDDEIAINPDVEIRSSDIVTHVEIKADYNGGTRGRDDTKEYQLDESDTIYGEMKRLQLTTLDNTEHWFGDIFMRDRALERIFGRFGNAPVRVSMEVFLENQLVQIGDVIDVTYPKLPLLRTASLGWTAEGCEIIVMDVDYGAKQIRPRIAADNVLGIDEADIQDIAVFEESDIDDTTLSEDANHAAGTLQAADAYIDQGTYKATNVMVEIELIQPGAGGGSDSEYITLYVKIQNPAGTDVKEEQKRFYYDETSSETIRREFYVLGMTSTQFARIRTDWTAHSGANAPTTVKMTRVKMWDWKGTISTTDLK